MTQMCFLVDPELFRVLVVVGSLRIRLGNMLNQFERVNAKKQASGCCQVHYILHLGQCETTDQSGSHKGELTEQLQNEVTFLARISDKLAIAAPAESAIRIG